MSVKSLLRENIRNLIPYSAARNTISGDDFLLLDANENPIDNGVNRYPDPVQNELKERIAVYRNVRPEQVFVGNGSDEILDLLIRAFCEPGRDEILITPPTYGMYEVLAMVNGVGCIKCPLNEDFSLNIERVINAITENTKLIFLCSPNNPTGNCLDPHAILRLLNVFKGIVVLDEAYIDFAENESLINDLNEFRYLFVNQTFSKSIGAANIRLGMGFSNPEIIAALSTIKPPYNVNGLTQNKGMELLSRHVQIGQQIARIKEERDRLSTLLKAFPFVLKVYPSEANFLLVKVKDADNLYQFLFNQKIIVRNRSNQLYCENTIRISIGTEEQNNELLEKLLRYAQVNEK